MKDDWEPFHRTFVPTLTLDGNKWCALYGENPQTGISGFGPSPVQAIRAFDIAFHQPRGTSVWHPTV